MAENDEPRARLNLRRFKNLKGVKARRIRWADHIARMLDSNPAKMPVTRIVTWSCWSHLICLVACQLNKCREVTRSSSVFLRDYPSVHLKRISEVRRVFRSSAGFKNDSQRVSRGFQTVLWVSRRILWSFWRLSSLIEFAVMCVSLNTAKNFQIHNSFVQQFSITQ